MNMYYILFGIILFVFIFSLSMRHIPIKEGYESYERCIKQGYPHNFCFYDVPVISML